MQPVNKDSAVRPSVSSSYVSVASEVTVSSAPTCGSVSQGAPTASTYHDGKNTPHYSSCSEDEDEHLSPCGSTSMTPPAGCSSRRSVSPPNPDVVHAAQASPNAALLATGGHISPDSALPLPSSLSFLSHHDGTGTSSSQVHPQQRLSIPQHISPTPATISVVDHGTLSGQQNADSEVHHLHAAKRFKTTHQHHVQQFSQSSPEATDGNGNSPQNYVGPEVTNVSFLDGGNPLKKIKLENHHESYCNSTSENSHSYG